MKIIRHCGPAARPIGAHAAIGSVAVFASAMMAPAAHGQDAAGGATVAEALSLDPVIVTARKIEEDVQRIPFGISVFGAAALEREGITELRDFARNAPGLNLVDSGLRGANLPNIRGVGTFTPQSADDSSVPVFIDGVPLPIRAQDREFFDVQQIEVLRGPQNSLYGRNAQAGAINVTTVDPTFEPFFEIGGEVGNEAHRRLSAIASGGLTETLAGRIGGRFETRDGDFDDLNLGEEVRDQQLLNANGKLLWLPTDDTDVTLAVRYGVYDEVPTQGVWLENPDFPQQFLDRETSFETETIGAGLTVRHDFDAMALTLVSGVQYYRSDFVTDSADGLVLGAITGLPPEAFNDVTADFRTISDEDLQLSQEVRLDGELDNGIRWVTGVNVFHADFDFDVTFNNTGFVNGDFDNEFTTTSYAGFGEVTVPVTDRLNLIGGLRYTRENKDFEGQFRDLSGTALLARFDESGSEAFNLATGRFAISYDVLPTLTGFASVARGAKSGGFQLLDTDVANGLSQSRFDTAYTWSYEAGLRGTLLDGRWDVSASAFFNDTSNEHLLVFDFTTFESVIENADTETYGIELETAVRPVTGLTLSAGLAWLETEITRSDDPTVSPGNEVPNAPSLSYNLSAEYEHPVQSAGVDGLLFGRVDYQFVGSRTVDPQNNFDLGSYDRVNLRAGFQSGAISVYAFADNVFDETYAETAFLFGSTPDGGRASLANPGQPRLFGLGATIRF